MSQEHWDLIEHAAVVVLVLVGLLLQHYWRRGPRP